MVIQLQHSQASLVSKVFVVAVFIPFISPVPVPAGVQPIVTILAGILICFSKKKLIVHKAIILQLLPVVISLVFFTISFHFSTLRSLVAYTSCTMVTIASYVIFKSNYIEYNDLKKILIWISFTWLFFGLLQLTTKHDISIPFKHYIWDSDVMGGGRGYSSLATEPSYYGTICIFIFFVLFYTKRLTKLIGFILIFQILFIAQSTITFLYLLLFFITISLSKISFGRFIRYLLLFSLFITILFLYSQHLNNSNIRILYLIGKIVTSEPHTLLLIDDSMNHRFQHVFFSMLGAFENYMLPQSIDNWPSYYNSIVHHYKDIILTSFDSPNRIMSGIGGAFFELGLFGIIYPIQIITAFKKFIENKRFAIFSGLFFITIMFSAIPIALPPFGFLIGLLLSKSIPQNNQ